MSTTTDDHSAIDFARLEKPLAAASGDSELFQTIVNAPFDQKVETALMFLGIIVLLLVNKKTATINRIALSNTELAKNTLKVSIVPFEEIKIPVKTRENVVALAIKTGKPQDTTDWRFLFSPVLSAEQARINQASAGIAYSAAYPLRARDGGALIYSYYQYEQSIGEPHLEFMEKYTTLVAQYLNK